MNKTIKAFDEMSTATKVIGVVLIVVVIYFLQKFLIEQWNKRPATVNFDNIPVVGTSSTGQVIQWNPETLAKELSVNLEGSNLLVYPETVQKILDLQTDDQVKLLYNYYNKNLATDYPTLTQLIDNEWADTGGVYASAVARLKSLGLK